MQICHWILLIHTWSNAMNQVNQLSDSYRDINMLTEAAASSKRHSVGFKETESDIKFQKLKKCAAINTDNHS